MGHTAEMQVLPLRRAQGQDDNLKPPRGSGFGEVGVVEVFDEGWIACRAPSEALLG